MNDIYRFQDCEYSVVRHPRRKRATIVVSHDGRISVRIPRYYPKRAAHEMVAEHIEWIRKKLAASREKHRVVAETYDNGTMIPFLGDMYSLRFVDNAFPLVSLYEQKIIIHMPQNPNGEDRRGAVVTLLVDWYRERAAETIPGRIAFYGPLTGVNPKGIKIKSTKSLWGSCTGKGILNFNWKIILAPMHIVDYLVVHELCHLVHRNHSRKYWKMVDSIIPDYKERDKWLRIHGSTLTL